MFYDSSFVFFIFLFPKKGGGVLAVCEIHKFVLFGGAILVKLCGIQQHGRGTTCWC